MRRDEEVHQHRGEPHVEQVGRQPAGRTHDPDRHEKKAERSRVEQHDPSDGLGVEHRVGEDVDAAELHVAAGNDAEGIVVLKKQPVGVDVPQHGSQQHDSREEPHLRYPPPTLPVLHPEEEQDRQPEI
jgi:hypothetical protein